MTMSPQVFFLFFKESELFHVGSTTPVSRARTFTKSTIGTLHYSAGLLIMPIPLKCSSLVLTRLVLHREPATPSRFYIWIVLALSYSNVLTLSSYGA